MFRFWYWSKRFPEYGAEPGSVLMDYERLQSQLRFMPLQPGEFVIYESA
jgi:hypothetical protein